MPNLEPARCAWVTGAAPDYLRYHDEEWGRPVADDRRLFEKLCLEGFQSGLSWLTILRKRDAFRAAFAEFDIDAVANFGPADVARLLGDAGIVRHRGKIEAAIGNARAARDLREECGSLAAFVWRYEPDDSERPARISADVLRGMTTSAQSVALSRDLKKRGWAFVGPTTMYAFMQSMGLVNDHLEECCVRQAVQVQRSRFVRPR
ncbi:MAG: DNA-3-methyladenine glycosylase I [Burkholderiaceae bacterium]|nr:DNA-3-methyladenine glycosylase I [Burkholderiaceae bacterium]MBP7662138.1 DNA-3-methyladenine glycosylase I [Burkholderiaceae bacterium]